jgi:hypothetical protein
MPSTLIYTPSIPKSQVTNDLIISVSAIRVPVEEAAAPEKAAAPAAEGEAAPGSGRRGNSSTRAEEEAAPAAEEAPAPAPEEAPAPAPEEAPASARGGSSTRQRQKRKQQH